MRAGQAAALILAVALLRSCGGRMPEPPESVCPWAERPECSAASSKAGVRWRLLIRQPQDGATVIYGGSEYPSLLLQITFDFDDECAMVVCSLDGHELVQGQVCMFATVAWEVPLHNWVPGLMTDSKWVCRASGTAGHGRTITIEDVSTVHLVWAVEGALFDRSLSPERLRELHASTGGNATLWRDTYLQTVHSGLSWGDTGGGMSEYRQKMQIRRGSIRIPTRLGHGASIEFLPPLHPGESSLPGQQTSFRAYVVHVPAHTERWRALESNFDCVRGLVELFKWPALPLNDTRLIEPGGRIPSERYYAFKSLTMSMTDAWQHWAQHGYGSDSQDGRHEADEWAFFLEDDVDWHPDLKNRPEAISAALMEGLRLAKKDGLAVLGWCVPKFAPIDDWRSDSVEVRRGNGMCGHAMAMTRWRAGSLAAELSVFKTQDIEQDVHIDVLLRQWIRKGEGNDFATQVFVCLRGWYVVYVP